MIGDRLVVDEAQEISETIAVVDAFQTALNETRAVVNDTTNALESFSSAALANSATSSLYSGSVKPEVIARRRKTSKAARIARRNNRKR